MGLRTEEGGEVRRFFFHYRKQSGGMSVHWKGACLPCDSVRCLVPCETKRNKRQPKLVMRGFAKEVTVIDGTATIR